MLFEGSSLGQCEVLALEAIDESAELVTRGEYLKAAALLSRLASELIKLGVRCALDRRAA